jgi:hypothetical protein
VQGPGPSARINATAAVTGISERWGERHFAAALDGRQGLVYAARAKDDRTEFCIYGPQGKQVHAFELLGGTPVAAAVSPDGGRVLVVMRDQVYYIALPMNRLSRDRP